MARNLFRAYYALAKPGIIYGNVLTAAGGFLLASKVVVDLWLFLATLAGIALIIGSACAYNNYIDRGLDKKMARTRQRPLVQGIISGRNALVYATVLGSLGFAILAAYTNLLTVILGLVALFDYVVLYGITKRRGPYGTLVGSFCGAMPVVAGYTAVTNHLDAGALILFLILVFWQMPHFYAIATYRFDDYAAAGLPVLPVKKGIKVAKWNIVLYIAGFVLAALALAVFGYAGVMYASIMGLLGAMWSWKAVMGFGAADDKRWARGVFFFSLIVISTFSFMISLDALLP